ncbi:uncharacterized protein [Parasteatoda tepidariorum]|uniref:uncharacterized protein n=1 Tax=Parasteatoda tepidariorum TaxID=114398 RepID=UPI00077FB220
MAEGGPCPCNGIKKKSGFMKMLGFGRKKKKKTCKASLNCPECLKKNLYLSSTECPLEICPEKQQIMTSEAMREHISHPANIIPPDNVENIITDDKVGCIAQSRNMREVADAPILRRGPDGEFYPVTYHPSQHTINCKCPPCEQKRYDESMVAMDAQVILQNSLMQSTLTDTAGLMCAIS